MKYYHEVLKEGGSWLGSLRTAVQSMFINGSDVIWSGTEELRSTSKINIQHIQELGAHAVAGYHNEVVIPLEGLLQRAYDELKKNPECSEKLLNEIYYKLHKTPRCLGEG